MRQGGNRQHRWNAGFVLALAACVPLVVGAVWAPAHGYLDGEPTWQATTSGDGATRDEDRQVVARPFQVPETSQPLYGVKAPSEDPKGQIARLTADDGVELYVEPWLPTAKDGNVPPEKVPVILFPTPYSAAGQIGRPYESLQLFVSTGTRSRGSTCAEPASRADVCACSISRMPRTWRSPSSTSARMPSGATGRSDCRGSRCTEERR